MKQPIKAINKKPMNKVPDNSIVSGHNIAECILYTVQMGNHKTYQIHLA